MIAILAIIDDPLSYLLQASTIHRVENSYQSAPGTSSSKKQAIQCEGKARNMRIMSIY